MFPDVNPKQMQAMMRQMGMKNEEIDATKVTIETTFGKNIVINNPQVMKISMQGQDSWQITGEAQEIEQDTFKEDIQTIMSQTQCTETQAKQALEDSDGDLAEAILKLS